MATCKCALATLNAYASNAGGKQASSVVEPMQLATFDDQNIGSAFVIQVRDDCE